MNDNLRPLDELFIVCAFEAYCKAHRDGRGNDQRYMQKLAYDAYEERKSQL